MFLVERQPLGTTIAATRMPRVTAEYRTTVSTAIRACAGTGDLKYRPEEPSHGRETETLSRKKEILRSMEQKI